MGAPNRLAVYKATAQSIRAQLSELRLYGEPSTGGQGIIEGETMYALKTHASAQARQVTTALSDDSLDTAWSGIEIYLAFQQPVLLTGYKWATVYDNNTDPLGDPETWLVDGTNDDLAATQQIQCVDAEPAWHNLRIRNQCELHSCPAVKRANRCPISVGGRVSRVVFCELSCGSCQAPTWTPIHTSTTDAELSVKATGRRQWVEPQVVCMQDGSLSVMHTILHTPTRG